MEGRVEEKLGALRCSKCGNDPSVRGGEPIHLVVLVLERHKVLGVEDGGLVVHGFAEFDDGPKTDGHPYFECQKIANALGEHCGHRWPVPDWVMKRIYFAEESALAGLMKPEAPAAPEEQVPIEQVPFVMSCMAVFPVPVELPIEWV